MLPTYKAVLRGNELEWVDDKPESGNGNGSLRVQVTVLDEPSEVVAKEPNGKQLAAILEELARRDTFKGIPDPVAWQRENRKDRPMPWDEE